jgi:probable HAF family extracellular repeat protein
LQGTVIGESLRSGSDYSTMHAFAYSGGSMQDLGTLPGTSISSASDINDHGEIVGATAIAVGQPYYHAFLYINGQMKDLNSLIDPNSGWTLVEATGINNQGEIIGRGTNTSSGGLRQAFLLTPLPEPGFATLAGLMLPTLFRRFRPSTR